MKFYRALFAIIAVNIFSCVKAQAAIGYTKCIEGVWRGTSVEIEPYADFVQAPCKLDNYFSL